MYVYVGKRYINYVGVISVEFEKKKCLIKYTCTTLEISKKEGEEFIKFIDKLILSPHPLREEEETKKPEDTNYQ